MEERYRLTPTPPRHMLRFKDWYARDWTYRQAERVFRPTEDLAFAHVKRDAKRLQGDAILNFEPLHWAILDTERELKRRWKVGHIMPHSIISQLAPYYPELTEDDVIELLADITAILDNRILYGLPIYPPRPSILDTTKSAL